jgi:hypothetical protein
MWCMVDWCFTWKSWRRTSYPMATSSTINIICHPGLNPRLCSEKPASNPLGCGTATWHKIKLFSLKPIINISIQLLYKLNFSVSFCQFSSTDKIENTERYYKIYCVLFASYLVAMAVKLCVNGAMEFLGVVWILISNIFLIINEDYLIP